MSGRILQKGKVDDDKNCLPVSKGGTGSSNTTTAAKNLKLITNSMKNKPGGPIGIDSNGLISSSVLPPGLSFDSSLNVTGPLSLSINQVQTYTITDYDINTTYTLVALSGSISRSGSTITYTAPGTTGGGGFTINGKTFAIAIGTSLPNMPTITNPTAGSTNLSSSVNFTANAFSMLSGTDTHEGSDWQVATDAGFTTIVSQVTDDTINKTTWNVSSLLPNTTYYVRVRYKGAIYGYSSWSTTVNFITKSVFTPTTEEAVIVGSPRGSNDSFGHDVDINDSGTLIAVAAVVAGNPSNSSEKSGAVYIYNKSGSSYIQEIEIGRTTITGLNFGYSVAVSGDGMRIAIGHMSAAPSGLSAAGVAYIYSKVSGSWLLEAILSSPVKASGDQFGWSIDINGDGTRVVIGSVLESLTGMSNTGVVRVFVRSDVTWTLEATLTSSDIASGDNFGYSVAIDDSGSRVVISSIFADKITYPTISNRGYAYVFLRTGTSWTQEAKLFQGGSDVDNEGYGTAVDIDSSGTRVVISIPKYNNTTTGAVAILKRTGTTWALEATLLSGETTKNFGGFKDSVAINSDGSVVSIGDYGMDLSGNTNNGAVFMYNRSGTTWNKINRVNTALQSGGQFGISVALTADGSKMLVGARYKTISSVSSGAAYTFV